ncbi:MAG: hypothetical protein EPO11_06875 [Gammaproteobacteria bacterium]|nr:MAG: hypothetical protein EPO11_06875 [Gammaproteobacteria bacterium]
MSLINNKVIHLSNETNDIIEKMEEFFSIVPNYKNYREYLKKESSSIPLFSIIKSDLTFVSESHDKRYKADKLAEFILQVVEQQKALLLLEPKRKKDNSINNFWRIENLTRLKLNLLQFLSASHGMRYK